MRVYNYPRADTLRAKRKLRKEIRHVIRAINRGLQKDVFKDRFWVEIVEQSIKPWPDNSGWNAYFRIAFHDRKCPERDYDYWFEPHFIKYSGFMAGGRHVDSDLNDFIVKSDFWNDYKLQHKNPAI